MDNLFSYIIKDENDLSNVFHALLSLHKEFRAAIVELFTVNIEDEIELKTIQREYPVGDGRVDLFFVTRSHAVFIEIKESEWRQLTPNQPNGYIKGIKEWQKHHSPKKCLLVFLLPSNYYYRKELEGKISEDQEDLSVKIVTWTDVIRLIEKYELHGLNPYLEDFYNWLKLRYFLEPISFSSEEVQKMYSPDYLRSIRKLISLVDRVLDYIKRSGYELEGSYNQKWWDGEYGGYIKVKSHEVLWFGIWAEFWEESESHAPICFGVQQGEYEEHVVEKFKEKYKNFVVFKESNPKPWLIVPIDQSILTSNDAEKEILKNIMPWLEYIKTEI